MSHELKVVGDCGENRVAAPIRGRGSRCRHWLYTIWLGGNHDSRQREVVLAALATPPAHTRYTVYQVEKGNNGSGDRAEQLHVQGYIGFESQVTLAVVKSRMGFPWIHLEALKGKTDVLRAIKYCQKKETQVEGPWFHGEKPTGSQGRRSDIADVCQAVIDGKDEDTIAAEFPIQYVKYHGGLGMLRLRVCKLKQRKRCLVVVLWGGSGTGKTTRAWQAFPDAFGKRNESWWAGYTGQKVVIWDEFDSSKLSSLDFASFCDTIPLQVPFKGGHVGLGMELLIITTNRDPAYWCWANAPSLEEGRAWERRITHTWRVLAFDSPVPDFWNLRTLLPSDDVDPVRHIYEFDRSYAVPEPERIPEGAVAPLP